MLPHANQRQALHELIKSTWIQPLLREDILAATSQTTSLVRKHRSVVGAIVLALRVQDTPPIVRLEGPLRIGVYQDLNVAPEEGLPDLEDCNGRGAASESSDRRANDRGRGTPLALRQAAVDVEEVAVLRLKDTLALHLRPHAERDAGRR